MTEEENKRKKRKRRRNLHEADIRESPFRRDISDYGFAIKKHIYKRLYMKIENNKTTVPIIVGAVVRI